VTDYQSRVTHATLHPAAGELNVAPVEALDDMAAAEKGMWLLNWMRPQLSN